jgi:putative SOS response-associated peptidase YedK
MLRRRRAYRWSCAILREASGGSRRCWGLIPFWSKDGKSGYSTIDARAETVATSSSSREPFKTRRCLVPADGWYEWKLGPKERQPYRFALADGGLMGFAGPWERWTDKANGETVRSLTIIRGAPNPLGEPIHDRMPVILEPVDYGRWLGEEPATAEELKALLRPYPIEPLRLYPISQAIGNVKNDGPDLVAPIGPDLVMAS